jgi:hypothetical protein
MMALGAIAKNHQKLCQKNPLIENRVWLNCFDENDRVREAARTTWSILTGGASDDPNVLLPPSPMYAVPLLPLLHHSNASVAKAAAEAYAHGVGKHPVSIERTFRSFVPLTLAITQLQPRTRSNRRHYHLLSFRRRLLLSHR